MGYLWDACPYKVGGYHNGRGRLICIFADSDVLLFLWKNVHIFKVLRFIGNSVTETGNLNHK